MVVRFTRDVFTMDQVLDTLPALPRATGERMAALLDPAINDLFTVTLELTALASSHVGPHTEERLLAAVDQIDETIRRLRHDLIEEVAHA